MVTIIIVIILLVSINNNVALKELVGVYMGSCLVQLEVLTLLLLHQPQGFVYSALLQRQCVRG